MCPVPQRDLDNMENEDLYDMLLAVREKVLEDMEDKKERELVSGDMSLVDWLARAMKKRQRLDIVKKNADTVDAEMLHALMFPEPESDIPIATRRRIAEKGRML